ncbi:helix-turn-helix transcriptional regulator [Clostridium sporogenes]|uniref:helix-turn-helix domain-containing protein n=1 Tax=Clostridium sporogenes TaxID=1509 RepID=UPI000E12ABAF|nr:helix-turn-helix transcriptional regulator [Clostridium sporogenes]MCW6106851.1 helix-turn-helix domain-containing protein [Clostridium sporogenes]NFQ04175.1 helix-turn-helix transcriptional regulator [Clostridium sporogenes]NFQ43490.1 helix-turn-helix transcriptional regulator [Clostridium sporogenes]NFT04644.1 helix-turn-helix transcriptional regulator [Clostridium sporogenes]NFT33009.1 helix-turn-helix transcriptional regulator [Clostridium sporogenes]
MNTINIGDRIKQLRKEKGLTQQELAIRCELSKNAIWNYENNKRKPNIDILSNIATVLGVSISEIYDNSKTLTSNLIKILDLVIFNNIDAENTTELIWESIDIDMDLLDNAMKKDIELPEEDLLKILKFIQKENNDIFIKFITENIDAINKFETLNKYCNYLLIEHRRIEYVKKLYDKYPNDKILSNIIKNFKLNQTLSDKDIKIIDSYKEADYVNNILGGDLALIPGAENEAYELFKKLLISLGYTKNEIAGYNAYLFKKIKAQLELEIKLLKEEN